MVLCIIFSLWCFFWQVTGGSFVLQLVLSGLPSLHPFHPFIPSLHPYTQRGWNSSKTKLRNLLSQTSTPCWGCLGKSLSFYSFINQSFRRSKLPLVLTSWSRFDPKYSFSPIFDPRLTVYYSSKVISYSRFTETNIWSIRATPTWYLHMETSPYSIKAPSPGIGIREKIHRITRNITATLQKCTFLWSQNQHYKMSIFIITESTLQEKMLGSKEFFLRWRFCL